MRKLCTVAEIREAEAAAVRAGVSLATLMRRAGEAVASVVLARWKRATPGTVLVLTGPGNNGGDGLVTAAILVKHGWHALVWGWRRTEPGDIPAEPEQMRQFQWVADDQLDAAIATADVILDAVFGIGGKPDLPEPVAAVFTAAHRARQTRGVPLVAVDVPSGVDAESGAASEHAFRADVTVMLGLPKVGLYRTPALRYAGELVLQDIGLPEPPADGAGPWLITEEDVRVWLPRREADTHKWRVGSVLVVSGAPTFYGAPRLAASAAARAGAGIVTLAVLRSLIPAIAPALPEVTYIPLPEGEVGAGSRMADLVRQDLPKYRVLLVGPGLGQEPPVGEFLGHLFGLRGGIRPIGFGVSASTTRSSTEPFAGQAVIDADGLNWLATQPRWWESLRQARLILTPHPGELARLLDTETATLLGDPWQHAREAAQRFGQHVLFKYGHATVACPDGRLLIAPQVLPALATAGTGDVLAGITAGLYCQGLEPDKAAAAAVWVGNAAAQRAISRHGTLSLVASDLVTELPGTLASLYEPAW